MRRTFDILIAAQHQMKIEDALIRDEEIDVQRTLDILSHALTPSEHLLLKGNPRETVVSFSTHVTVAILPASDRDEARNARRKYWEAGPLHDEIWDGFIGDFREVELTTEELNLLLKRNTRVVHKIRSMLWMNRKVNIDARSHARKVETDDLDEVTDAPSPSSSPGALIRRKSSFLLSKFMGRRSTASTTPTNARASGNWLTHVNEETIEVEETEDSSEE
jgi:hypothetical protein